MQKEHLVAVLADRKQKLATYLAGVEVSKAKLERKIKRLQKIRDDVEAIERVLSLFDLAEREEQHSSRADYSE